VVRTQQGVSVPLPSGTGAASSDLANTCTRNSLTILDGGPLSDNTYPHRSPKITGTGSGLSPESGLPLPALVHWEGIEPSTAPFSAAPAHTGEPIRPYDYSAVVEHLAVRERGFPPALSLPTAVIMSDHDGFCRQPVSSIPPKWLSLIYVSAYRRIDWLRTLT
jgi:hypothetical protein